MSARAMLADVVTSLTLGADDYITKTFRIGDACASGRGV